MNTNNTIEAPATLNLPDLHQATLDRHTLEQLFTDLETHAEVSDVIPKFAQRGYVPEGPITLAEARKLLFFNSARANPLSLRRLRLVGHDHECARRFSVGADQARVRVPVKRLAQDAKAKGRACCPQRAAP
jgi:hypothetical protein